MNMAETFSEGEDEDEHSVGEKARRWNLRAPGEPAQLRTQGTSIVSVDLCGHTYTA
jgi:hypothetical protein